MDEAISLLREQTVLRSRLITLLDELLELLKTDSPEIENPVKKINPVISELTRNESKSRKFLETVHAENFAEYVSSGKDGIQREVAERLLAQIENLEGKLRKKLELAGLLTVQGAKFAAFNLHVLSQTRTSPTYGASAKTETRSDRRIFEANV